MKPSKNWCAGFCRTCGTGCAQYCEEVFKLKAENARLREALEKISAGGVGYGILASAEERMIVMAELAKSALEGK